MKYTVLGGAAVGFAAAAAVYGVSTSSSTFASPLSKPAVVSVAPAPAPAARCSAGEKLTKGVCIIHVERIVMGPAPLVIPAEDTAATWDQGAGAEAFQPAGPPISVGRAQEPVAVAPAVEEAPADNPSAEDAAQPAEERAEEAEERAEEQAEDAEERAEDDASSADGED